MSLFMLKKGPLFSISKRSTSIHKKTLYLVRVELYFVANSIGECPADAANRVVEAAAKKKLAIFLTVIGKDAYRVAQTLCSPKSPNDYTYTELVGILKKHYTPVKLQIAESFKFRRCAQNDNESISEFVSRLRKCASTCNYESFLERALKEQFTVGLRNKETQLKLLSKEHSLEESIQQAIADEAAFRESAIIVPSSGGTNVNHVKQFPPKKTQVTTNQHSKNFRSKAKSAAKPVSASSNTATGASTYKCYSCGQSVHKRSACRFREVVCNKCSQKGHIAKYVSLPKLFIVWKKLTKNFITLLLMLLKDCLLTWMLRGEM